MNIQGRLFVIITLAFAFQNSLLADKIYLKSGKIFEGKVINKRESYNSARDYCQDYNDIVILDNNTYRCVPQDDFVRVEKEFKKPEGLALLAKESRWGTP